MPMQDYYGQVMYKVEHDLNLANLQTRMFKSRDGKYVFLLAGMNEQHIKEWADQRDIDLPVEATDAIRVGRTKNFPLAVRTQIADDVEDDKLDNPEELKKLRDLPQNLWTGMHVKYDEAAPQQIYKHFKRLDGVDDSPRTPFSEQNRLRLLYEAIIADKAEGGAEIEIQSHLANSSHPMIACFPLHNQKMKEDMSMIWLKDSDPKNWLWVPIQKIRRYFGEPVAFYFAFMTFYMRWLIFPSIIGFIFFIVQLGTGDIDNPSIPILCFAVIFWCVGFVDFWFREEARLRLRWGMTKFQEKAVARPQFTGEWTHDSVTGLWIEDYLFWFRLAKSGATMSFICTFMGGCVVAVVAVLLVRDGLDQGDSVNKQLPKVGLGVANGVMIAFFDVLYRYAAFFGTEWENHRTEQDYQNALIFKAFIFRFFNSFSSLFYLAFVRSIFNGQGYYIKAYPDICKGCDKAKVILLKEDGTGCKRGADTDLRDVDFKCCVTRGECENGSNYDMSNVNKDINKVVLADLRIQLASLFVTAILIQNAMEVGLPWLMSLYYGDQEERQAAERGEQVQPKSKAEKELMLARYDNTIDDMSEIMVQFGYVTLFVMALPITPFLALVNNVIELRVDGTNLLVQSQRPHVNGSYGLGAWNSVLSFFSIIAVGTNVALLVFRTKMVENILADQSQQWIAFSLTSIILAMLVSLEKAAIPDEPIAVTRGIERQHLIESVLVLGANVEMDEDDPPIVTDEIEEFPFRPRNPRGPSLDEVPLVPLGDLTQLEELAA
jgi:hypothetical protein